ncbi:MAG: efflux RND transporter permease subunit [bacterium]
MLIGLGGMDDIARLKDLAEDTIKPRLERLEGVASVTVEGGVQREIQVNLHRAALAGYGLDLDRIVQVLAAGNLNLPGGTIRDRGQEFLLRTTGEFRSVEDVKNLPLMTGAGVPIKISDLGTVEDGFADVSQMAYLNSKPAIGIQVQKKTGANTVQVGQAVKAELKKINTQYPELSFINVFDQSEFIEKTVNSMGRNAFTGALLAIFVLLLFLQNFRSTLVIATAIPISVVATFILVHFAGLTMNIMTLGGVALGVGMLVDNAIVVLENIYRFREKGYGRMEAARLGADEVGLAVTASTLTTVGVFLPIVYIEGMISEIFRQLALTVTFSLLVSLLVSLTLVPLLSSRFLKLEENDKNNNGILKRYSHRFLAKLAQLEERYGKALRWCLANRKKVLALAVAFFILSLVFIPLIGAEFFPGFDEGRISINVNLPIGSSLAETEAVGLEVGEMVARLPEVAEVFLTVGSGGQMSMGGSSSDRANLDISLVPLELREQSTEEVAEKLRHLVQDIPGAEINVNSMGMLSAEVGGGAAVSIGIKGDDLFVLGELAEAVKAAIEDIPGIRDVETSLSEGRPEIQIRPDRNRLAQVGLTTGQIARAVDAALRGQVATKLRLAGEEIDIRVRLANINTARELEGLVITTPLGQQLVLGDMAEFVVAEGPQSIQRENQVRVVTVSAGITGRDLGSVMADVQRQLALIPLPEGYYLEYGGEYQEMADAFSGLGLALVLAIVIVYAVLAAQFESLLHPFTIMFSVPFAFTGAVLGLFLTGHNLNVPSAIGGIMLVGIVVNNAIVLVDYINILRERGMELTEAIITAGKTRLRPILMTTLTTILGLFPLALGIGEGAEAQAPLATVVMGGLLCSTLLTLLLVPTLYTVVDGIRFNISFASLHRGISRRQ